MSRIVASLTSKARIAVRLAKARLPDRLSVLTLAEQDRYDPAAIPDPIQPPEGNVRVMIGPANFAGQGHAWARAAERLDGVAALNMQYRSRADYGFPADYAVPESIWSFSRRWGVRQRAAVGAGFTHVLYEAERALFGAANDKIVSREARWLRQHGVNVGMICHGTDIRLPSRHREIDPYSPFHDADPDWVASLEARARANHAVLDRVGAPVFVSTPEMVLDRPDATWLPVVVHADRWVTSAPVLSREVPVVLHAPTNPQVKGTHRIEPVVDALHGEGLIDYRRVIKVPAAEMPALYADADIVLEQFALGMYSVTAVEAMAAGRLVIAHVHEQVRDHVREITGLEIPVVSATPDTLDAVLRDVRRNREHYQEIAARGPEFVDAVHNGDLAARVLAPFLGATA